MLNEASWLDGGSLLSGSPTYGSELDYPDISVDVAICDDCLSKAIADKIVEVQQVTIIRRMSWPVYDH